MTHTVAQKPEDHGPSLVTGAGIYRRVVLVPGRTRWTCGEVSSQRFENLQASDPVALAGVLGDVAHRRGRGPDASAALDRFEAVGLDVDRRGAHALGTSLSLTVEGGATLPVTDSAIPSGAVGVLLGTRTTNAASASPIGSSASTRNSRMPSRQPRLAVSLGPSPAVVEDLFPRHTFKSTKR